MTVRNGMTLFLAFAPIAAMAPAASPIAQPQAVIVENLKPAYSSCGIVAFDVRNTSTRDLYVEVFPEDFTKGSWRDVGCPYDLKDPKRRGVKRIQLNPPMLKPGASIRVSYDRCSDYEWCVRPKYGKRDARALRGTLERQDRASSTVEQRVRVDLYTIEGRSAQRAGVVVSEPFKRLSALK